MKLKQVTKSTLISSRKYTFVQKTKIYPLQLKICAKDEKTELSVRRLKPDTFAKSRAFPPLLLKERG